MPLPLNTGNNVGTRLPTFMYDEAMGKAPPLVALIVNNGGFDKYLPLEAKDNGDGTAVLVVQDKAETGGLSNYGADLLGQDALVSVVAVPGRVCHNLYISVGNNGVLISLDGGVGTHFAIPANTDRLLTGLSIAAGADIQARNLVAGNNYTNLNISVW